MPFKLTAQFIFAIAIPLVLYYMDRFDKVKDSSLGWVCIAEKIDPRSKPLETV
jgi:hypothetical protein